MNMETNAKPKTLTSVANTPGSCPIVNYAATKRYTTMITAAVQRPPINIPFMMSDYLSFLAGVNSPESSYYWANGNTSQHMKKLI